MYSLTKHRKILALILFGIVVKLLLLLYFHLVPVTFENTTIAKNFLADGNMYYLLDGNVDYNHQFPFYGWILICFFKIFGVVMLPIQIFQILLNACFAWIIWRLFNSQFKSLVSTSWIGFTLVIIALFHPLLSYYQLATIHPITLDVLLFAGLMYVSLIWESAPSLRMSLLLFLVLGITLLERSTLAVAVLPAAILTIKDKAQLIKLGIIAIAAVSLFAFPWMARNHNLTGKYEMTSGTWRYMWVGIQEETDGTNVLSNGDSYYALFPKEIAKEWSSKSLQEQMSFYRGEYQKVWQEDPSHIALMWGVKLKNMFWFSAHAGGTHQQHKWVGVYKIMHGVLLFLFVIGFVSSKRKGLLILMSAGLALALLQSFFYVETRHAMPFQFILWIGALLGLEFLISRFIKIEINK